MREREAVQHFLSELGHRLGTPFTLDQEGACPMIYGDGRTLTVEASDGIGCVLLHAPVAVVPSERREDFFRRVLKLNLMAADTGGCVLGLDDVANAIMLAHIQSLESLDPRGFENLLANFIERAGVVRNMLAEPRPGAETGTVSADEAGLPGNLGMRV